MKLNGTKAIIFDFDGTILDSFHSGALRFLKAAERIGLSTESWMLNHLKELWRNNADLAASFRSFWPQGDVLKHHASWVEVDKEFPLPLTSGAKIALHALSTEIELHILTARDKESTHHLLNSHGIIGTFKTITTLHGCEFKKPDPRCMEELVVSFWNSGLKLDKNVCYVGDTIHLDCELARNAGIPFIGITAGASSRDDFLKAEVPSTHIIDSLIEIAEPIISRLAK